MIIPEEAELLIPVIRALENAPVHLMPYAAPTKYMVHSSQLASYMLPSPPTALSLPLWLPIELGLLGARLYFDFEEYSTLLDYVHRVLQVGGPASTKNIPGESSSETSIVNVYIFLQEWLTTRRKGQDILHTPMGYICQGRQLEASHPFFFTKQASQTECREMEQGESSGSESEDQDCTLSE